VAIEETAAGTRLHPIRKCWRNVQNCTALLDSKIIYSAMKKNLLLPVLQPLAFTHQVSEGGDELPET